MSTRLLYNLVVPAEAQTSQRQRQRAQILSQGVLQPGPNAVEGIAADPGTQTITARVRGRHAALTAREFEELFANNAIDAVPYFAKGTQTSSSDRYVALEDVNTEPGHPFDDRVQRFDGSLTTKGTRRSHWRAVRTNPTTVDNPFGSGSTEEVAIPAQASKTRWFDREKGTLDDASAVRTETGEHDDIAVYDLSNTSISNPTLIYDVAYRHEWPVDVRVWDDYDRDKEDSQTVNGDTRTAVQWQRVFDTSHDYVGIPIFENDLLRLEFDEANQLLSVSEWNDSNSAYESVSLGNSSWRLFDLNTRRIGIERLDAQVEFVDTNSPSTKHNLNLSLKRGQTKALWTNPSNEGSVPSGLVTRLDPIASSTDRDPAAVSDLVERQETDR